MLSRTFWWEKAAEVIQKMLNKHPVDMNQIGNTSMNSWGTYLFQVFPLKKDLGTKVNLIAVRLSGTQIWSTNDISHWTNQDFLEKWLIPGLRQEMYLKSLEYLDMQLEGSCQKLLGLFPKNPGSTLISFPLAIDLRFAIDLNSSNIYKSNGSWHILKIIIIGQLLGKQWFSCYLENWVNKRK